MSLNKLPKFNLARDVDRLTVDIDEKLNIELIPEISKGYFVGLKLVEPYGKNDGRYIFVI